MEIKIPNTVPLKKEVLHSIIAISLSRGNRLAFFFQDGTEESIIRTFIEYFQIKIYSPTGKKKHYVPVICASGRKIGNFQFFCQIRALPGIDRGDLISISAVIDNKRFERDFEL